MGIPEFLYGQIMDKTADGWSSVKIVQWLDEVHHVKTTDHTLRRHIKKIREERALFAQTIVKDKLAKVLTPDLDKVGKVIERALEDELRCRAKAWGFKEGPGQPWGLKEGEVAAVVGSEHWQRLMTMVRGSRSDLMSALELRLKLAGAEGGKPTADTEDVRNQLMSKIDTLLERYAPKPNPIQVSSTIPAQRPDPSTVN